MREQTASSRIAALLLLTSACLLTIGCASGTQLAKWPIHVPIPEHLFAYEPRYVISLLRPAGYSQTVLEHVARNQDGTKLIVSSDLARQPLFIMSSPNDVSLIHNSEGSRCWVDNSGTIFAALQSDGGIKLSDGRILAPQQHVRRGFDLSGQYLFEHNSAESWTRIFDVDDLNRPVILYESTRDLEALLLKNATLYCLESTISDGKASQMCRVFQRMHEGFLGFNERPSIRFPAGEYFVDLDPWSELFLLREFNDFSPDRVFLFDSSSGQNIALGPARFGIMRFLDHDLLERDLLRGSAR